MTVVVTTPWNLFSLAPLVFSLWLMVPASNAGTSSLKFNRSQFLDVTSPCSRTGIYNAELNSSRPAALLKLDIRYKTLVTYQTFDCIVKVKAEFQNKSKEYYNDNEDIAVMMFDINYGYRRKEETLKLDLIHIAKLDRNGSRFFYQKKEFMMPQYVPKSLPGYVLYGFESVAQWHAEANSSISVHIPRWRSSGSLYMVFVQYRIVSPYHCDTGIEVDCSEDSAVFAHCFPSTLLNLFLDGLPFCEFYPIHSIDSNRTLCYSSSPPPFTFSLQLVATLAFLHVLGLSYLNHSP